MMYNRYIPQPDGTYQRSRVQDNVRPSPPPRPAPEPICPPEPQPCAVKPESPPQPPHRNPPQRPVCHGQNRCPKPRACEQKPEPKETGVGSFLKNLLPKDFDTGDLLIVLLLLLMSGDCGEGQNNALLTLALYLFM